jgi:hypothetical protein
VAAGAFAAPAESNQFIAAEVTVALRPHSRTADCGYVKCNWWLYALAFIESAASQEASMIADSLENRRVKQLEKRIADLERFVGWLTGLLIDFVAVVVGIGAAIFVAGDYYRLSAVDGSVVLAFTVTMLALNFIFRKAASWCLD